MKTIWAAILLTMVTLQANGASLRDLQEKGLFPPPGHEICEALSAAKEGKSYLDMSLGDWLRIERKRMGWGQTELARRVGVTQKTISKWEAKDSSIKVEAMKKLLGLFYGAIDDEWTTLADPEGLLIDAFGVKLQITKPVAGGGAETMLNMPLRIGPRATLRLRLSSKGELQMVSREGDREEVHINMQLLPDLPFDLDLELGQPN